MRGVPRLVSLGVTLRYSCQIQGSFVLRQWYFKLLEDKGYNCKKLYALQIGMFVLIILIAQPHHQCGGGAATPAA